MCCLLGYGATVLAADRSTVSTALTPESSRLVIEAHGVPPPAPVFFSGTAEQVLRVTPTDILGEAKVTLRVVQGKPEVLALGLAGEGEVIEVVGNGVREWAVRQSVGTAGGRFVEVKLAPSNVTGAREVELVVRTRVRKPTLPGNVVLPLVMGGEAVGFSSKITVRPEASVDVRVVAVSGLTSVGDTLQFFSSGEGRLEVKLAPRGGIAADVELLGAQLAGRVNEATRSVEFRLRGSLRAQKAGARLRLLAGAAALNEHAAGDGWHVELVPVEPSSARSGTTKAPERAQWKYELVADREGMIPVELAFAAAIREAGDWRTLEFSMPAGAVVPLLLEGLSDGVAFKPDLPVVPVLVSSAVASPGQRWQGFLPADGTAALAWRRTRESAEAALAFTTVEHAEVRIGAGLLRQSSHVGFRILQGKLGVARFRLEGAGDILGVEGANVLGWKVVAGQDAGRVLEVRFSRALETQGTLTIQSQAELGASPVRAEPLRLIPEGGVRHSGFVRVANAGAVRLEITDAVGMMQLAPAQWPGAAIEAGVRQVFVHRLPSANYSYRVLATQIQPEVAVAAITTYELGETTRVINASIELDVREAALREWSIRIPENYAVVALTGEGVSDYVAESEVSGGARVVRVLFAKAVEGRQLLQMRLEANQPATAGDWSLPALQFPGARAVRGHVGVIATPGYRIVPGRVDRLVEVPLNLFPRPSSGLQQAWRLRELDWTAEVRIEALGQSVQADVFHLYTLKEGVVSSSVLLNYFVVGAPASEWRVEVPAGVGNLDVIGQNVRRDWRREGDQVVVSLHQPVLGAGTLLITFEQPMSARGGTLQPGAVRPIGVQAERGFVQVVSPLQVKYATRRAEGALLKLEPAELPTEYRTFTNAPSLATYHYTGRPFALELAIEWYAPGETVEQVVDFAKLATNVSRDGQVVTEAQFFVKTRGRKALRVVLPVGAKLWEARVDQELVNARADGAQTLIPLPARTNPNDPVVVALRVGQPALGSGSRVTLTAPCVAEAPTVINEWTVRGDSGRLLVPRSGNAALVRPPLTETGFEWIGSRAAAATLALVALTLAAVAFLRAATGWRVVLGLVACALATAGSVLLAGKALVERRANVRELTYATSVMPAGEAMTVELGNVAEWRAMVVSPGVAVAAAGVALLVFGGRRGRSALARAVLTLTGALAISAGVLAQHRGAVVFFALLGLVLVVRLFVPALVEWRRERRTETAPPPLGESGASGAVTLLLFLALVVFGGTANPLVANESGRLGETSLPLAGGVTDRPAQAMVQRWTIREERLRAEVDVTVRAMAGESFLLLRPPAVLTEFQGDGIRVNKVERDGQTSYYLAAERAGTMTARVRFEMPLADRTKPILLPTGPAAAQRVTIELDQGGWEFTSTAAVQIVPATSLPENRSGATLVLAPQATPTIQLQPRRRDLSAEQTQFVVEGAQLFVPGPGVVNGVSRLQVRPVQGRVSTLELEVPAGLTVGEVSRGPIGAWRFDPQTRRLQVAIEPAQAGPFRFEVETQLGAGELPFGLKIEPLRVRGAASDVGTLALAFGGDAQPESVRASEVSVVNLQDFDSTLLPKTREGQAAATLHQVWRYGPTGGRVELKVAAVEPEVRVASRQVLSLDDDRIVLATDLRVAITRVGIFKLSLALPDGLEVEALSGPSLSQWTEAQESGQRIVTLHLNGRTIGEQAFNLVLAGAAPGAQAAWAFPRLSVREATRQTGEVLAVPGKGIRLRAVDRERVTQLDPRSVGGMQPGTLAFRLLQDDWVLRLGIELLEPWVTVQALHEVTAREGQTLTRIGARYRVENAAVKTVQVRLRGLSEETARTVRATGPAVSDVVKLPGADDLWEIRFQRSVAGETDVQIEFQSTAAREAGREMITVADFVGARQTTLFVGVRGAGRLELAVNDLPRGWTRVDWAAVPTGLQNRGDRSVPALTFRVAEPERPLAVVVRRHDVAEALKLRATRADLLTLFAPTGAFLTAVELNVEVLEKSTLRVRLPAGARLFNTLVNGESVTAVRDGEAWLFHVAPHTPGARAAAVRLVYAATALTKGDVALSGPSLSVPLENVTWRVVLPPGYDLDDYSGALRLREERVGGVFTVGDYQSLVSSKRSAETKEAAALLQQANSFLAKGEQEKASEAFSRVTNIGALDEASNEDARVQLRNLKTQQAVLGLNTRRQRLYLDNRGDAVRNDQLEQAASLNPFMQGKVNFDPRQVDQLLQGNSSDENTALRGIATKIVDQQLGTEPAPGAIDVTLPERGKVFTFTRSLQVDGGAPLELRLEVEKIARTNWGVNVVLLLGIGAIVLVELRRRMA